MQQRWETLQSDRKIRTLLHSVCAGVTDSINSVFLCDLLEVRNGFLLQLCKYNLSVQGSSLTCLHELWF